MFVSLALSLSTTHSHALITKDISGVLDTSALSQLITAVLWVAIFFKIWNLKNVIAVVVSLA